jgi:hypothetical protein
MLSLLRLSDVMGTGHHATLRPNVSNIPPPAAARPSDVDSDASQLDLELSFDYLRRAPSSRSASMSADSAAGCWRRLG